MSLALSALRTTITGAYSRPRGLGSTLYNLAFEYAASLTDGTGANQADILYLSDPANPLSLGAGADNNLDLSGTTPDAIGDSTVFVKVKVIAIKAEPTNTDIIRIGGAAANPFLGPFGSATFKQDIGPNGLYHVVNPVAGWTVTPGTGDILRINNPGAGTALYHVLIIGCSA